MSEDDKYIIQTMMRTRNRKISEQPICTHVDAILVTANFLNISVERVHEAIDRWGEQPCTEQTK